MADLFTRLAQGTTAQTAVRPRLPGRFEEAPADPGPDAAADLAPQQVAADWQPEGDEHPDLAEAENVAAGDPRAGQPPARPPASFLTSSELETVRETGPERPTPPAKQPPEATAEPIAGSQVEPSAHVATRGERAPSASVEPAASFSSRSRRGGTTQETRPAPDERAERRERRNWAATPPTSEGFDTIRERLIEPDSGIAAQAAASAEDRASRTPPPAGPSLRPAQLNERVAAEFEAPSTSGAPTIEVHIGRIELRQPAPPARPAAPAPARFEPPLTLSAYLKRRNGGAE